MIPYGRQDINASDIEAVERVLRSDFLTQGPAVPQFENAIKEHSDAAHAIACNSATSALHMAYLALGLRPGDEIWTSPITFVATANAALFCGANIRFIDIDLESYTMDLRCLEEELLQAKAIGKLPKIVVPVHLAGQSCDMKRLHALSKQFGFSIVEDASHSIGASFQNQKVGSCQYSDICIFSFHPVKIITTAEGGAATTQDADLASKMYLLRSHGVTRDPERMKHTPQGAWYYEQIMLGYNYRMTEIQAALGASQINRLDDFLAERHARARFYDQSLNDLPLLLPYQRPEQYSALHLYPIRLSPEAPLSRDRCFDALRGAGIGVNLHYIPVYKQPYYQEIGYADNACPNAEAYYSSAISIPLYPGLTEDDQAYVIQTLHKLLS